MQVGQKRGSLVRKFLNIEDGFKFHFLVTNDQFLIFNFSIIFILKIKMLEYAFLGHLELSKNLSQ